VSTLYDEVRVAVMVNDTKRGLFSVAERIEMISEALAEHRNVLVESFHGLLVDYCREHDVPVIVKGIRAVSDFDYELQMAQLNYGMTEVETVFLPTNPIYSFLSSSRVKEIASYGGDVSALVPPAVRRRLRERFA
jgi:pantetheine-phosphate adenylyltransferase